MLSQFKQLGEALAQAAPQLQFAAPVVVESNGRTYWSLAQVGEVHGLDTLCAFDEHNEEYLVWDGGSPYLDWCSTSVEEAEHHDAASFETIEELLHRLHNPED